MNGTVQSSSAGPCVSVSTGSNWMACVGLQIAALARPDCHRQTVVAAAD